MPRSKRPEATPGIGPGTRYKFQVLGRDGVWREKADPLAFTTEVPPATASVVWSSDYAWGDDAWLARIERFVADIKRDGRLQQAAKRHRLEARLVQIALDAGFDGRQLLKTSETASVQAEYDANTEAATAASVFGSPWYIVDGEGYWGQDRLDFVERALSVK